MSEALRPAFALAKGGGAATTLADMAGFLACSE